MAQQLHPAVIATVLAALLVLFYAAGPRSNVGLFVDVNTGMRSLSRESLDEKHLLTACRPTMRGMRAHAYDPSSLLMPSPKEIASGEASRDGSPSVVMLGEVVNVFAKVLEEGEDDNDNDEVDAIRNIHDSLHQFCMRSCRPISISSAHSGTSMGLVTSVVVDVHREFILKKNDESFTILIKEESPGNVSLSVRAGSVKGALHAINSALAQLFSGDEALLQMSLPFVMRDWPENRWRGVMVDVARHFLPIPLLKRTIEGMAISRLNTLHLHLTDANAFRVYLEDTAEFPRLSALGRQNGVEAYTLSELKELVEFARKYGISVMPEVDVPAHVASWSTVFPDLVIICRRAAEVFGRTPKNVYTLDISQERTLALVREIMSQLMTVFSSSSNFFHLGGDELHMDCWEESESMLAVLRERYNNTGLDAKTAMYKDFESRLMSLVLNSHGKTPVVWSGVQESGAIPATSSLSSRQSNASTRADIVVETWKCWGDLAVRAGMHAAEYNRHVLMSACWYLDFNHDWLEYLSTNMAQVLPVGTVKGGEGAIWTENVDHTNFECRVWPRLGAIAYRLWGFDAQGRLFGGQNSTLGTKTIAVKLSVDATRSLYLSYIHFRSILQQNLHIKAAGVVFHIAGEEMGEHGMGQERVGGGEKIMTQKFPSVREEKRFVLANLSVGGTLATSSKLQPRITSGSVRMTSQCLSMTISEEKDHFLRPTHIRRVLLSQANVAGGEKDELLVNYLREKASLGTALVGMCELNGWQRMRSSFSYDITGNRPQIDFLAAEAGFAYSHIVADKDQPYNIGAVSALPFTVLAEYGPKQGFERGLLHLMLDNLEIHVLIAHLNAHDSVQREVEAAIIASIVKTILRLESEREGKGGGLGAKVVVMGDLNTLSRWDSAEHRRQSLTSTLKRTDPPVWQRLAKKFLKGDSTGAVNYAPMDTLLAAGLHDSCVVACRGQDYDPDQLGDIEWQARGDSAFSRCMTTRCLASEPTNFDLPDWEWPKDLEEKHPPVRLDFILLSSSLVTRGGVVAGFDIDGTTRNMSDHFPMSASWEADRDYPLY